MNKISYPKQIKTASELPYSPGEFYFGYQIVNGYDNPPRGFITSQSYRSSSYVLRVLDHITNGNGHLKTFKDFREILKTFDEMNSHCDGIPTANTAGVRWELYMFDSPKALMSWVLETTTDPIRRGHHGVS